MLTIYSKNNCPYCVNAKNYLENRNINYREINVEQDPQAREFIVSQGHRTLPQIYFQDKLLVPDGWQGLKELSADEILERIKNVNLDLGTL
jgi:glutaredoxin